MVVLLVEDEQLLLASWGFARRELVGSSSPAMSPPGRRVWLATLYNSSATKNFLHAGHPTSSANFQYNSSSFVKYVARPPWWAAVSQLCKALCPRRSADEATDVIDSLLVRTKGP